MRKKALFLGGFALIAAIVMAQSALATHETVQKTAALTGSVVPTYKSCGGTEGKFHAAPVSFPSCTATTATNDTSPLMKPRPFGVTTGTTSFACSPSPCGFTSAYNVSIVQPSPGPPTGFGAVDAIDSKVTDTATGTLCEKPSLFLAGVQVANCPKPGTPSVVCPDAWATQNGCPFDGNVIGESTLRTTDQNNCTAPCASGTLHGTVQDFDFSFVIPCTAGNCNISSTADAQFGTTYSSSTDPTVKGKKADIEVLSIRSQDPGANGTAGTGCPLSCGDGDENDAARQGLYIQ